MKGVFRTRTEVVLQHCNLKASLGLSQEGARKSTRIVCEQCILRCFFCTAKYLLSSIKNTETEPDYFSIREAQCLSEYENMHFRPGFYSSLFMLCGCLEK